MKKFRITLPRDVKQIALSLLISISLLCGSIFMLSSYMDSIRQSDNDLEAMASPDESECENDPERNSP